MLITLLSLCLIWFSTTVHAQVTREALIDINERLDHGATAWVRAQAKMEYARLVAAAMQELGVERSPADGKSDLYVVRKHGMIFTTLDGLGVLPSGVHALTDQEGNAELFLDTDVRKVEVAWPRRAGRSTEGVGWAHGHVRFDDEDLWLLCDPTWTTAWIRPERSVTFGTFNRDRDRKALVVIDGEHGPDVVAPYQLLPGYVVIGDQFYDVSAHHKDKRFPQAHSVQAHPKRPAWIEEDGALWRVTTVGSSRAGEVYRSEGRLRVAPHVVRPVPSSLEGKMVARTIEGNPYEMARVAHVLENGALVTSLNLVLEPGEFTLDPDGRIARDLRRRDRKERLVDALLFIPRNTYAAVHWGVTRLKTKLAIFVGRRQSPRDGSEQVVLSRWPWHAVPTGEPVARQLIAGDPANPLVRDARTWARKFGAVTYLKPPGEPARDGEFTIGSVTNEDGGIQVVLQDEADKPLRAHEGTHVRNTYHRAVLNRVRPRANRFVVTPGRGFKFLEHLGDSSYNSTFFGDETHATAVEAGVMLNQLEEISDNAGRAKLVREISFVLGIGRSFLVEMEREIILHRETILATSGRYSVLWRPGSVDLFRTLVQRTPREDLRRFAMMQVHAFTWWMDRERRMDYGLASLDAVAKEIELMKRIYAHLERRLVAAGGKIEPPVADCSAVLVGE